MVHEILSWIPRTFGEGFWEVEARQQFWHYRTGSLQVWGRNRRYIWASMPRIHGHNNQKVLASRMWSVNENTTWHLKFTTEESSFVNYLAFSRVKTLQNSDTSQILRYQKPCQDTRDSPQELITQNPTLPICPKPTLHHPVTIKIIIHQCLFLRHFHFPDCHHCSSVCLEL